MFETEIFGPFGLDIELGGHGPPNAPPPPTNPLLQYLHPCEVNTFQIRRVWESMRLL